MTGEIYEVVNGCFLCVSHNCAMAGWNDTGNRLQKCKHGQASQNDAEHSPDNKVCLFH